MAARGNPAFSWERVLSAYRAIEDHRLGASEMRGAGGPLGVSVVEEDDEILHAIPASGQEMGWERVADTNASDGERIGFVPAMITNGVRNTAFSAFVRPVRGRPNLTVLTQTRVGELVFDGGRVAGVRASNGTGRVDYSARKEVILSAGTIETPLLLERSGIGRPEVLRNAGVDLRVESPNVGERIVEQSHITMQFRLKGNVGETERLNTLPKQAWEGFKYLFTRSGPIAEPGFNLVSGFKSSPDLDRPDIQANSCRWPSTRAARSSSWPITRAFSSSASRSARRPKARSTSAVGYRETRRSSTRITSKTRATARRPRRC